MLRHPGGGGIKVRTAKILLKPRNDVRTFRILIRNVTIE